MTWQKTYPKPHLVAETGSDRKLNETMPDRMGMRKSRHAFVD